MGYDVVYLQNKPDEMKLREVEKLKDAYERIRVLDGEIVEIEKMAMPISEKRTRIGLSLSVEDLEKKQPVQFDEDGSLMSSGDSSTWGLGRMFAVNPFRTNVAKSSIDIMLSFNLSDTIALRLLGELYASKDAERKEILKYFRELGVKS